MFSLPSNIHCDSFSDFHCVTPLLAAYEFMEITRKDTAEFELFESFAHDKQWAFDLNKVKRFLQDRKNTIVVTCQNQKIEWVSKGFSRMTGYDSAEALGQFPRFLQGKETSSDAKLEIRNKLHLREKYSGKIINYRKNGEKYLCKVDILPVFDKHKSLVNFIAFEHEVEL